MSKQQSNLSNGKQNYRKFQPDFQNLPELPKIEEFRLDHLLNTKLKQESQQVIDSLLNVTSNYQTDLRSEIKRKLSTEQKIQFKNIRIKKLASSINKNVQAETKKIQKSLRDEPLAAEIDGLLEFTIKASERCKSTIERLARIDQLISSADDTLQNPSSTRQYRYPHLHKLFHPSEEYLDGSSISPTRKKPLVSNGHKHGLNDFQNTNFISDSNVDFSKKFASHDISTVDESLGKSTIYNKGTDLKSSLDLQKDDAHIDDNGQLLVDNANDSYKGDLHLDENPIEILPKDKTHTIDSNSEILSEDKTHTIDTNSTSLEVNVDHEGRSLNASESQSLTPDLNRTFSSLRLTANNFCQDLSPRNGEGKADLKQNLPSNNGEAIANDSKQGLSFENEKSFQNLPLSKASHETPMTAEDFEKYMSESINKYRKSRKERAYIFESAALKSEKETSNKNNLNNPLQLLYSSLISNPKYIDSSRINDNNPFSSMMSIKSSATIKQSLKISHHKKLRINGAPIKSLSEADATKACSCNDKTTPEGDANDGSLVDDLAEIAIGEEEDIWVNKDLKLKNDESAIRRILSSDSDSLDDVPGEIDSINEIYIALNSESPSRRKYRNNEDYYADYVRETSPSAKHRPSHHTLKPKRSILKLNLRLKLKPNLITEADIEEVSALADVNIAFDRSRRSLITDLIATGTILSTDKQNTNDEESLHSMEAFANYEPAVKSITNLKKYIE